MSIQLLQGDCIEVMKTLPAGSVQTCVTSPPYWGLRDYGVSGQLGLEATPEEYTAHMVDVFREVRRVLRDDGILWLNLGDSYAAGGLGHGSGKQTTNYGSCNGSHIEKARKAPAGLKEKDLVGIPWRVAFALQDDGWYLRSDIIWHKPNPMPESVTDRPTKSHEYIFLMSKQEKYYYDAEAVREASVTDDMRRPYGSKGAWDLDGRPDDQKHGGELRRPPASATFKREGSKREQVIPGQTVGTHRPDREDTWPTGYRNRRSVWTVATQPYSAAHFATFPPKLIEPCIQAGSRPGDTVLDPFNGAGTTGLVSIQHNRDYIGIDLNPDYLQLSRERFTQGQPLLFEVSA
jgi:DNA modification methylase